VYREALREAPKHRHFHGPEFPNRELCFYYEMGEMRSSINGGGARARRMFETFLFLRVVTQQTTSVDDDHTQLRSDLGSVFMCVCAVREPCP
jgi:hypothetical protein